MRSLLHSLRRAWFAIAVIALGLVILAGARSLRGALPHPIAPPPAPPVAASPAPLQPLRGVVVDRRQTPQPHVAVALYAVPLDDSEPSRCGGSKPVHLLEETCDAAQAEVKRRLDAGEFASKPLEALETDDEGRVEIVLPTGKYDLAVIGRTHGFGLALDVSPGGEPLTITLGQDVARGTVWTADGAVLPGATVAVVLTRPRLVWMAETSPAGEFVAGPVPSSKELVAWVNADGYLPATKRESTIQDFRFSLWPKVRLTGVVRYEEKPVDGAEISGDCGAGKADAEGRFSLEPVNCEGGNIVARKGMLIGWARGPSDPAASVVVELFEPKPIAVRVIDAETKQPMAAVVTAFTEQLGDRPEPEFEVVSTCRVETRGPGDFVIHDLRPGAYTISAKAEGFAVKGELVRPNTDSITIELARGQVLEGVVVDDNDEPVVGAVVEWGKTHVTSNAKGIFAIPHVDADIIKVTTTCDGYETEVTELYLDADHGLGKVVRLQRRPKVQVRVVGPDGQPVRGASVACSQENGGSPVSNGTTDEGGTATCDLHFWHDDVPLTAFVRVSAAGFATSADEMFEFPDGKPTMVKVTLEKELMLGGTVVDERGKPVPGVLLTGFLSDDRHINEATSGANGEFRFQNLKSGSYEVYIPGRASPSGSEEPFAIARAGDAAVRIVLPRKMSVRGMVKRDGAPVSRLSVNDIDVVTRDGRFVAEVAQETKGDITLKGDFVPLTRSVAVVPGTEMDLGVIEVEPLGAIDARVTSATGRARAWVGRANASGEMGSGYVDIDETGHFLAPSRLPGRYVVVVNTDRGELVRECDVHSGQTTTLDFTLARGARLKDSDRRVLLQDEALEAATR